MTRSIFKIALCAVLAAFSVNANAQKTYTEGLADYTMSIQAGAADTKVYFTTDSNMMITENAQYTLKMLADTKGSYMSILVEVPMISMKQAATLSPAEIATASKEMPKFTFSPTTETRQINGFNCKKVNAKDANSGSSSELWVTNDIKMPPNVLSAPFVNAGGVPIKFTTKQQGQMVNVELKSVSAQKVASGTFTVPSGHDKISFETLKAFSGQQ